MKESFELRIDHSPEDGFHLGLRFHPGMSGTALSVLYSLIDKFDWPDDFRLQYPKTTRYQDPSYTEVYLNPGHFVTLFHEAAYRNHEALSILGAAHRHILENFGTATAWNAACKEFYERSRR